MVFDNSDARDIDGLELAARIRDSASGSRELDLDIAALLGEFDDYATRFGNDPELLVISSNWAERNEDDRDVRVHARNVHGGGMIFNAHLPAYTTSLDESWKVITRKLPVDGRTISLGTETNYDGEEIHWAQVDGAAQFYAATHPLALCSAVIHRIALDKTISLEHAQHEGGAGPRM